MTKIAFTATTALSLVAIAMLGIGTAAAQPERKNLADTDGDGKVTRAEQQASVEQRFLDLDADSDGYLSRDEMNAKRDDRSERREARRDRRGDRRWSRVDADGDDRVSRGELAASSNERFAKADTDGDGVVTRAEARAAMQEARGRRGDRGQRPEAE